MTYYAIEYRDSQIFIAASAHTSLADANRAAAEIPVEGSIKEVFVAAHPREDLSGWIPRDIFFELTSDETFYSSSPRKKIKTRTGHISMSDVELHRLMGFIPCGVVAVTKSGSVTITLAKPEEVRTIYGQCKDHGLSISKGLEEALRYA